MISDTTELSNLIRSGYRYARSLSGNHEDSEDLVQQAALKLFRKYGNLLNRGVLFKTIKNAFLDQMRRKAIATFQPLETAPETSEHFAFGANSDIETVLAYMNRQEREAVYLNIVEGYTADEVGERQRAPAGTVLSRICRARTKIAHLKRERYH